MEATDNRVLVIDDNEAIHSDIRKILTGQNRNASSFRTKFFDDDLGDAATLCYEIDSALQGKDGYEMVKQACECGRCYAMAFVDMRMPPGWDGLETIENLWRMQPDLQVVICSAYSDYSWSDIHNRLGRSDQLLILKKPFETAEVCQIVSALTKKWTLTRRARVKADAQEAHMRAVVETAAEGIMIFDNDGVIESLNPAGAGILQCSATDLVGRSAHELFLPEAGGAPLLLEEVTLPCGNPSQRQREMTAVRPNGIKFPIQLTVSAFDTGECTMYACIFRDLTEQKKLQLELAQAHRLESVG